PSNQPASPASPPPPFSSFILLLRIYLASRPCLLQSVHNKPFAHLQSFLNHPHSLDLLALLDINQFACFDCPLLAAIVCFDHQEILSALVNSQRKVGNEQNVL